jgi:hypothetical protein
VSSIVDDLGDGSVRLISTQESAVDEHRGRAIDTELRGFVDAIRTAFANFPDSRHVVKAELSIDNSPLSL